MVALLTFGTFEVTAAMVAGTIVALLVAIGVLTKKHVNVIILACAAGTAVTVFLASLGL
jgi:hypothetical protein